MAKFDFSPGSYISRIESRAPILWKDFVFEEAAVDNKNRIVESVLTLILSTVFFLILIGVAACAARLIGDLWR